MTSKADRLRLRDFYRALQDRPLWPDDPLYVDLFANEELAPSDPVDQLATTVEFAALESTQLFSGHRGTGKSTQLRRLKRRLEQDPTYKVVLCDMEDYLPMADAVDVVDFLLGAAGAVSEQLREDPELLGAGGLRAYWDRFVDWLGSQRIEVDTLGLSANAGVGVKQAGVGAEAKADIKVMLKSDPVFRKRVRDHTKLHIGAFREEVHAFIQDALKALQDKHGEETQLVIVFDSLEHLRGTTTNAEEVAASVENLFRGHADALRIPYIHTIYTVPPWLRLQAAGIGGDRFDGYVHIPCIKVKKRDGAPCEAGLAVLREVAGGRGDLDWLLGSKQAFQELALVSGGYLRDLFRLLSFIVRDANVHGVPSSRRELAVQDLRNAYMGFTNRDSVWLRRIAETHEVSTDSREEIQDLARFLDTHLVLGYRNGEDWYDVHPVILGDVHKRAAAYAKRQLPERDGG
ncbi:MAG: hypothetical protein H6741_17460 [Alphaproteobacteria bacterium]|nr:hypothetical protein [Alphaproteobacteria bacterium]MCB9794506.1 hypothetical protein [Alphaproteobacteria bacterium]